MRWCSWQARTATAAAAAILAQHAGFAAAHYGQAPCQSDEVQGEVQGATGYTCAPKCSQDTYSCPTDAQGATAQPQCMLQDVQGTALCGLLCQVDAQCPTGSQCKQQKQAEVGICLSEVSFSDWARQPNLQKLAVGWPSHLSGQSATLQVAKTSSALQNLKTKYSIGDGDVDMAVLQDLLSSLGGVSPSAGVVGSIGGVAAALPALPAAPAPASGEQRAAPGLTHDLNQFQNYASQGLPGFEKEMQDTLWNIEHLDRQNSATNLLTGLMWIAAIYLGAGSFFKYQQGSRGYEMLPHLGFWLEYPNLVNDGVIYAKILTGLSPQDAGTLTGGISGGLACGPSGSASRGAGGAGAFEAL